MRAFFFGFGLPFADAAYSVDHSKKRGSMLQGNRAIITGSNSGVGLGVAEELARAGADVVLNSFTDRAKDHALAADLAALT